MFYDDIVVPIPAKKRVKKATTGHKRPYVYEILKRKGKDSPKDVVMCVGVAINDTEMNPNEKYYEIHPEYSEQIKPNTENLGEFDSQIHLGASMLLRAAARKTGLAQTLKEVFPGYEELIQSLLEYYMLERDSTSQLYKYYAFDHYTEMNYIPSETQLSQFFNDYITHGKVQKFLEKWMKLRIAGYKNTKIDIDFDSTNFNINSKDVESAERGKAKVDEGLPQVNVAYFLERKTGIPVYYDIYYGSIIDMEHCKTAVGKLKDINPDMEAAFVMDRGYFSQPNLNYLESNGYNYLCMGKSTREFHTLVAKYPFHRITKAENRIYGTIYGVKEYGKVFQEGGHDYHIYLYFDYAKVVTELPQKQDQVEYFAKFLIGKKDLNGNIQRTFGKSVDLQFDDNKVIISATPKYGELDKLRDSCGYFWIISDQDITVEEALLSYRHRDMVEKAFRGIKSGVDLNKMYSSSDSAFESKSLLAFMTAILRAEITMTLRPYFVQYSSETTQTVLKEMEKIKAEQLGEKYRLRYALTHRQKQILSFYDMTSKDAEEYVDTVNKTISLI